MADAEKVTLDFADWRYDEWTYRVDGNDYTVSKGGSDVPAGKAEKIIEASKKTEAIVQKV